MTYNIHACVGTNRNANTGIIAGIIEKLNADVVALQEVDAQKPLSANRNQARTLAAELHMEYVFFRLRKSACIPLDLLS